MKTGTMILTLIVAASAQGSDVGSKSPLKADFNALISETQQERSELAHDMSKNLRHKSAKKADQQKIIDFIDVEVGWKGGDAPVMTDRRFDSVNEPVVVFTEEMLRSIQ